MGKLAIIDEDAEHIRAAYWRRRIMLMKPDQLSEHIGYSWRQIYQLETGEAQYGGKQDPNVWLRYRMACAALHARKYGWARNREFDWKL